MNMFEEAQALCGMINMCSLTQSEIAKKMGVSQSYVANKLRLLKFSQKVRALILDAGLTERHARILLRLGDEALVVTAIEKIKAMRLSVAASEALVDNMIVEAMPRTLSVSSPEEGIVRFEGIIRESIKNLLGYGFKVKQKTDYLGKKKFITITIE